MIQKLLENEKQRPNHGVRPVDQCWYHMTKTQFLVFGFKHRPVLCEQAPVTRNRLCSSPDVLRTDRLNTNRSRQATERDRFWKTGLFGPSCEQNLTLSFQKCNSWAPVLWNKFFLTLHSSPSNTAFQKHLNTSFWLGMSLIVPPRSGYLVMHRNRS